MESKLSYPKKNRAKWKFLHKFHVLESHVIGRTKKEIFVYERLKLKQNKKKIFYEKLNYFRLKCGNRSSRKEPFFNFFFWNSRTLSVNRTKLNWTNSSLSQRTVQELFWIWVLLVWLYRHWFVFSMFKSWNGIKID